jgi:hypothetical protein
MRCHPGLQCFGDPIRIAPVGFLARRSDHPQVIGIEGQQLHSRRRQHVVDELRHLAYFLPRH